MGAPPPRTRTPAPRPGRHGRAATPHCGRAAVPASGLWRRLGGRVAPLLLLRRARPPAARLPGGVGGPRAREGRGLRPLPWMPQAHHALRPDPGRAGGAASPRHRGARRGRGRAGLPAPESPGTASGQGRRRACGAAGAALPLIVARADRRAGRPPPVLTHPPRELAAIRSQKFGRRYPGSVRSSTSLFIVPNVLIGLGGKQPMNARTIPPLRVFPGSPPITP